MPKQVVGVVFAGHLSGGDVARMKLADTLQKREEKGDMVTFAHLVHCALKAQLLAFPEHGDQNGIAVCASVSGS